MKIVYLFGEMRSRIDCWNTPKSYLHKHNLGSVGGSRAGKQYIVVPIYYTIYYIYLKKYCPFIYCTRFTIY